MITPAEAIALDPIVTLRRDLMSRIETEIRSTAKRAAWPCEVTIEVKYHSVLEGVRAEMFRWKTSVVHQSGFLPRLRIERPSSARWA